MNQLNKTNESFFNVDWDEEFNDELSDRELEMINKAGERVAELGMTVPAIMFLETMKPFNWIGSQVMLFMEPFTAYVFGYKEIIDLRRALSKRPSVEHLIQAIEEADYREKQKNHKGVLKPWVKNMFSSNKNKK